MLVTNSAHAFSHSLINSCQLFPAIIKENLGEICRALFWITAVIYRNKQSIFHFEIFHRPTSWTYYIDQYGPWICYHTTFKYCFGFIQLLPSQDQFHKPYLERTMKDLQQKWRKVRYYRNKLQRSLYTRRNIWRWSGSNDWEAIKKKELIKNVWQYLIHHRKNPVYFVGQICSVTTDGTILHQKRV